MLFHKVNRRKQAGRVVYYFQTPVSTIFPHAVVRTFEEHMGFQRKKNQKKEKAISKYLSQPFWSLPELTLVCDGNAEFVPYDTLNPDLGSLEVDHELVIIDGQHRINGAHLLFRNSKHSLDTALDFKVYHHLELEEQIQVFVDLNKNLSKVTLSLIRFLTDAGFNTKLALRLAEDRSSPFHERVSIDGQKVKKLDKVLTLESLARSIEIISKSVKFSVLPQETRADFIEYYFTEVYNILKNFWTSNYRILNTYGISFLGVVGREYMQECLDNGQLNDNRFRYLVSLLGKWDWERKGQKSGLVSGSADAILFLQEKVFNAHRDNESTPSLDDW